VNHVYVLDYNLKRLPARPPARLGTSPLERLLPSDFERFVSELGGLGPDDRREIIARLLFYKAGFHNLFGIRDGQRVVYVQWLVVPEDNPVIQHSYPNRYLLLRPNEAMVENAFALPAFRGRGLYPYAMHMILAEARDRGLTRVVTYIRKTNLASLTQTIQMGFRICRLAREWKILGRAFTQW
jgi:GNAT superfamily N-acetyltransferase